MTRHPGSTKATVLLVDDSALARRLLRQPWDRRVSRRLRAIRESEQRES